MHCPAASPALQPKGAVEPGMPLVDEHVLMDDNRFIADIM